MKVQTHYFPNNTYAIYYSEISDAEWPYFVDEEHELANRTGAIFVVTTQDTVEVVPDVTVDVERAGEYTVSNVTVNNPSGVDKLAEAVQKAIKNGSTWEPGAMIVDAPLTAVINKWLDALDKVLPEE